MRLIDAEELVNKLEIITRNNRMLVRLMDVVENIIKIINDCETVEENKWIPCSERLPSSDGEYKVTIDDGNIYTDSIMYSKNLYEVDKYDFEDYEEAIEKDGFYDYWEDDGFHKNLDVIAWMEETKPYQPKT